MVGAIASEDFLGHNMPVTSAVVGIR